MLPIVGDLSSARREASSFCNPGRVNSIHAEIALGRGVHTCTNLRFFWPRSLQFQTKLHVFYLFVTSINSTILVVPVKLMSRACRESTVHNRSNPFECEGHLHVIRTRTEKKSIESINTRN